MTKNKPVYHARISKQQAISSVYGLSVINRFIFGHRAVIHFIMQWNPTKMLPKNSPAILFI